MTAIRQRALRQRALRQGATAAGVLGAAALLAPAALAGPTNSKADVVVIMDESGSMDTEQAWIGPTIGTLDSQLQAAGVTDARYGLVGFGSSGAGELGRSIQVGGSDFGSASEFDAASGSLITNGSDEDGYAAMDHTLANYSFRPDAAVNFIFVTDEDRDDEVPSLTYASTRSALVDQGILLNAIVDNSFFDGSENQALGMDSERTAYVQDGTGFTNEPVGFVGSGDGNTDDDYVELAFDTGGAAWDLNNLRAGGDAATAFTNAFVDIKVEEISTQPTPGTPVPEPMTLALVAGGLAGAGTLVGRRARRA